MARCVRQKAGCSYEDMEQLTFAFSRYSRGRSEQGRGMLHGGIMCTAFDLTIAALARFCAGENFAPTISLDVRYIRPVKVGETLLVTGQSDI